jgi:hypothetical protein
LSGPGNQRVFAFEAEEIENCHDIAPFFERTKPFCFVKSLPAWVKVRIAEKHPSGAKARRFLSTNRGTTKVVPFQNFVDRQVRNAATDSCIKNILAPSLRDSVTNLLNPFSPR